MDHSEQCPPRQSRWVPSCEKQLAACREELLRIEQVAKAEAYADILEMLHRTPYISVLARGLRYKLSALEREI